MKLQNYLIVLRFLGGSILGSYGIQHARAAATPEELKATASAMAEMSFAVRQEIATSTFQDKLDSLGFSGGVGAVFMRGSPEVENAAVDSGGILRVDFKSKDRLGGILEAHHLFTNLVGDPAAKIAKIQNAVRGQRPEDIFDFSPGIMVGAELGENAIRSLGIGVIFSWRRFHLEGDGKLTQKVAFNLGAMLLIEQNVKTLADGFRDGSPLPTGQTAVRFKEESRRGIAITFSAGF
jgi:hypothetical protein